MSFGKDSSIVFVMQNDKLVNVGRTDNMATKQPLDNIEEEVWWIFGEYKKLQAKNERLKDALKKHKHSDKCFEFAANTARQHGNYYCIAECVDSHKQALKGEE